MVLPHPLLDCFDKEEHSFQLRIHLADPITIKLRVMDTFKKMVRNNTSTVSFFLRMSYNYHPFTLQSCVIGSPTTGFEKI